MLRAEWVCSGILHSNVREVAMIHVIFHKDWQTRHEDAMRNVTQGRVEGKSLGDSSDKPVRKTGRGREISFLDLPFQS